MYRFSFPTVVNFGAGARKLVSGHLKTKNFKRPLIVTDRGLAKLPICHALANDFASAGLHTEIFSEVWGNPVQSQVTAGVAAFKKHNADCIVGIGGGAALDVAKAIALMIHHPGNLFDYEDEKPGAKVVDKPIPHWIAIPTTSGTGSEVGRSAVISDDSTHIKKIIFSPRLMAVEVFADPELTLDLPAPITAATGADALTHCVEAYLAKNYHPMCDGIALEGLKLAHEALVKSVKRPDDLPARSDMMLASLMGAVAFQKGLGVTHSCAHALGTVTGMHHGLANAVMIDHALRFNLVVAEKKFRTMAKVLNLENPTPGGFIEWLRTLKNSIDIPANLTEAGVGKKYLPDLVKVAVADSCHSNNPRPVMKSDFEAIFSEAF